MAFITYDYRCPDCGHSEDDVLVESKEEICVCPGCGASMKAKFPVSNFQFGVTYFANMGGPRKVSVEYHQHDGKVIRKDIRHGISTDC